jgi:hypothetical protein
MSTRNAPSLGMLLVLILLLVGFWGWSCYRTVTCWQRGGHPVQGVARVECLESDR